MIYPFGKTIKHQFHPMVNDIPVKVSADAPSIHVYSIKPAREDALTGAGDGFIETISSWAAIDGLPDAKLITITAIDDPDTSEVGQVETYYLAINFKLQASEQSQLVIEAITLERVAAVSSVPNVTRDSIINYYPAIQAYLEDSEIDKFITLASKEVQNAYRKKGIRWQNLERQDLLHVPIAYKTIELASSSQVKSEGDKFDWRVKFFMQKYREFLEELELPHDKDADGEPEQAVQGQRGYVRVLV